MELNFSNIDCRRYDFQGINLSNYNLSNITCNSANLTWHQFN